MPVAVADWLATAPAWQLATVAALVVGGAHWDAHSYFGDEVFSKAAVNQAGFTTTVAT